MNEGLSIRNPQSLPKGTPDPNKPLWGAIRNENGHIKRPSWLKIKLETGPVYQEVLALTKSQKLNTVCEDARCPNIYECWNRKTATFMILGDVCTRSCGFCSVKTGKPFTWDPDEPRRVAEAIKTLGLRYAVITSVNRDELLLGGADIFAELIRRIRSDVPGCQVEVLVPDFRGVTEAIDLVVEAKPEVYAHNMETVPRLSKTVRPQASYERSLEVLRYAKSKGAVTKSSMMVGLGETIEEVREVMKDLRTVSDCDFFTVGQYLQPTKEHLSVDRFVHPSEFEEMEAYAKFVGFRHVASGPLVRSSYHADEASKALAKG